MTFLIPAGRSRTTAGVREFSPPLAEAAPAGIRSLSSWVSLATNRLPTIAEPREAPICRK